MPMIKPHKAFSAESEICDAQVRPGCFLKYDIFFIPKLFG